MKKGAGVYSLNRGSLNRILCVYLPAEIYIPAETLACSVHKKSVVQVH